MLTTKEKIQLAVHFVPLYAPDEESVESVAKFLGVDVREYDPNIHYPMYIARKCMDHVDALIELAGT